MSRFNVKETDTGKYRITGTKGYTLILDNRHDAEKHCLYLNGKEKLLDKHIRQNAEYYTVLSKIGMVNNQIKTETGELHILEASIKIKNLLKEVLP